MEDSSCHFFAYKTSVFDGNFYTGYQQWKGFRELKALSQGREDIDVASLEFRASVVAGCPVERSTIVTSGSPEVWGKIGEHLGLFVLSGEEMCADTKYFLTVFLQEAGRELTAYGDGMNDYFMLQQAERGCLVKKADGSVSGSLVGRDLGWMIDV